jgi:hypothetical protein
MSPRLDYSSPPITERGMSKPGRFKLSKRDEWKALGVIFLASAVPLMAAAALIVVSIRPDLGSTRFLHSTNETEAMTMDWPTLYRLNEKEPTVEYIRALLPTSPVRIPGYMIAFGDVPDKNGKVNQFLLVPDAGNWLHPPHLDYSGDVILVHLADGARTRLLSRTAVWVTGKLSLSAIKSGEINAAYSMWASGIQQMASTK